MGQTEKPFQMKRLLARGLCLREDSSFQDFWRNLLSNRADILGVGVANNNITAELARHEDSTIVLPSFVWCQSLILADTAAVAQLERLSWYGPPGCVIFAGSEACAEFVNQSYKIDDQALESVKVERLLTHLGRIAQSLFDGLNSVNCIWCFFWDADSGVLFNSDGAG